MLHCILAEQRRVIWSAIWIAWLVEELEGGAIVLAEDVDLVMWGLYFDVEWRLSSLPCICVDEGFTQDRRYW